MLQDINPAFYHFSSHCPLLSPRHDLLVFFLCRQATVHIKTFIQSLRTALSLWIFNIGVILRLIETNCRHWDTGTNVIERLRVVGWQVWPISQEYLIGSFRLITASDSLRDSWPTKLVDFRWTATEIHLLASSWKWLLFCSPLFS